jgi:hypothetical protein
VREGSVSRIFDDTDIRRVVGCEVSVR